jgi:hypothetical protein
VLKLRLKIPAEREPGIVEGLGDSDPQVVQLALVAAQADCPAGAVAALARGLVRRTIPAELRPMAIRVLGRSRAPDALHALLTLADGGKTWFGRRRLPPKSADLLAALVALAGGWSQHPTARTILALAARGGDPEIRAAAGDMAR